MGPRQQRTCIQNKRLKHGSVGSTVRAVVCVCSVCSVCLVVRPVQGTGPRQSALPAFCPLVFSLLMDGPCSAPSGYRILHINHHKHTHAHRHTLLSLQNTPDKLSQCISTQKHIKLRCITVIFHIPRQTEGKPGHRERMAE